MADEIVGKIPEFAEGSAIEGQEEVKETEVEETSETEKETPAELPAEEKQTDKEVEGLRSEREKLLAEIRDLRGSRRELKKEEPVFIEKKEELLKDVNPDDVSVVDKILKAKGYLTESEVKKMHYDSVKQEELDKFLEKYPEYKPDNDKNDVNWNALQRELQFYRMPDNPKLITQVLERAHKNIQPASVDRSIDVKKKQVQTASVGSQGMQRSSSKKSINPRWKDELLRGGWNEEDVERMANNLS